MFAQTVEKILQRVMGNQEKEARELVTAQPLIVNH